MGRGNTRESSTVILDEGREEVIIEAIMNQGQMVSRRFCPVSGKCCLASREADGVLNHVQRHSHGRRNCRGKNMPRRKYYCESCGSYHLTHYAIPFSRMLGPDGRAERHRLQEVRWSYSVQNEADCLYMS